MRKKFGRLLVDYASVLFVFRTLSVTFSNYLRQYLWRQERLRGFVVRLLDELTNVPSVQVSINVCGVGQQ